MSWSACVEAAAAVTMVEENVAAVVVVVAVKSTPATTISWWQTNLLFDSSSPPTDAHSRTLYSWTHAHTHNYAKSLFLSFFSPNYKCASSYLLLFYASAIAAIAELVFYLWATPFTTLIYNGLASPSKVKICVELSFHSTFFLIVLRREKKGRTTWLFILKNNETIWASIVVRLTHVVLFVFYLLF